jgi:5'-deoxynucleotidase YfbR-like HD superfamily hydrolase
MGCAMTKERILLLRECGNVRRCHTFPHVGEYTVGKHSYDVVMLILVLWPNSSMALVRAALQHDLAERWLGDVPATAKWDHAELAEAYRKAEASVETNHALAVPGLTSLEAHRLALADRVELYLWAQDQPETRPIRAMKARLLLHFEQLDAQGRLPDEVHEIILS